MIDGDLEMNDEVERIPPPSNSADQRLARVVGWVATVTTVVMVVAFFLVPPIAALIALMTWPKDRIAACKLDPTCAVSVIPADGLPVWVAFLWIGIIAVALIVCWKPDRWHLPSASARTRLKVRSFTSPSWLRVHALVAAGMMFVAATGLVGYRRGMQHPEFWWALVAALVVAVAATVCMQQYNDELPEDISESMELTRTAGVGIFSRTWRTRQRELHPRGKSGGEPGSDPNDESNDDPAGDPHYPEAITPR